MNRALSVITGALACISTLSAVALAATTAQAQGTTLTAGEQGPRYFYDPAALSLPAGQVTLTVANNGGRPHNFVIDEFRVHTPDIPRGQAAQVTFNAQPGTYTYYCDLPGHYDRGMHGTLTVTAAGTQQQAATAAPAQATAAPAQPTVAPAQPTVAPAATAAATTAAATAAATRPAPTSAPAAPAAPAPASAGNTSAVSGAGTAASRAGIGLQVTPLFISLVIHIPAAITWLGLALYDLIVVAVPFLSPAQRGALLQRPRWLVVGLIPVILVTGIFQTIYNPFGTLTDFASLERLRTETTYGFALFLKHGFVLASWGLTLLLTFWLAPRLVAFADDTSAGATRPSPLPRLAAWANFLACAALVLCVTVMVFQLH